MGKRSDGFERKQRGFYPTPAAAFAPLAPYLPRGSRAIEPCAGNGALCSLLHAAGMEILAATDIEPQHELVGKMDALAYNALNIPNDLDYFITNPPWPELGQRGNPTLAIVDHLRQLAPTWVLLPSDFMHNQYAAQIMEYCGGIISVGRVQWIPDSDGPGKDNCCWYLFGRQKAGSLRFIGRQAGVDGA